MATAYTDQVQKVYIAYYGRAADPVGLAYWAEMVESDGLDGIMASFGASAEATALYGSLSNTAKVNALYQQSFGRDADFAGLMYYAGQLTKGNMTAVTIAQNIFDGAAGDDATILANKLVVAKAYTAAIDTSAEVVAYSGTVAAASARALLTTVDAATVAASFDVATSVASIVSVASATPAIAGSTVALTTKTDSLAGSAGADIFNGVVQAAGATGTTAAPGDSVTGGDDVDTLSLSVAGTLASADYTLSALTTSSVEKVLLSNFETSTLNNIVDTSLMTGITHAGMTASSATGDTQFTNLKNLVEGEMGNGSGDLTLAYGTAVVAGTADSQTLNVSNTSAGTFTAAGVETVNVKTGLLASTLTAITAANATKITASGDTALTVNTALTQATIDASGLTGALTVTAGSADQAITGGSGDDTIDMVGTLTSADVVKGGLGTDTLKLSTAGTIDATATTGELIGVSGFETIQVASTADAATLNLTGFAGVTSVNAAANVKTVAFAASTIGGAAGITFVLNGTTYTTATPAAGSVAAGADAVAATINALAGFTAVNATSTITITAVSSEAIETSTFGGDLSGTQPTVGAYSDLTISNLEADAVVNVYSGDSVTANLADASGTSDHLTVNLVTKSADKGFNKTVGAVVASNIETVTIDATGMTDAKVTTLSALTVDAVTTTLDITGNSDLVLSDITSATKAATINAAAFSGDLTLTGAASLVQAITTGTGNDTIIMGSALTATDVIDGGGNSAVAVTGVAGKDTLTASGAIGTVSTAMAAQIANVETVQFSNGTSDVYLDAAGVTGASSLAFSASSGTTTLTNVAAGQVIGNGIGATGLVGTLSVTLADETGTADAITLAVPNAVSSATTTIVKTAGIETVNITASTDSGSADVTTFTTTNMAAANVVITKGQAANTVALGTLNVATTNVDASAYKGILTMTGGTGIAMTVSALGGVANTINTSTGSDTVTLTGKLGTAINVTNASTGTLDTLNATADNASTDFTSVQGYETINLTVSNGAAAGFNNATKTDGLMIATKVNILGGNSLSTFTISAYDANTAANTFDATGFLGAIAVTTVADSLNSFQTIKAGDMATDAVTTIIAGTEKPALMSGVETLTVNSTEADTAASIDLANVTGLTSVVTSFTNASNDDQISLLNLASGVKVKTTVTQTQDQLVIGLTDVASETNSLDLELTSFATVAADVLDLNAAGVETLNLTNKSALAGVVDLAGVDATSATGFVTVNVAGTGATTLNALNTDINVVNASAATGSLTLAAAQRDTDAMTVTGGYGADAITMENVADVMDGGDGVDTLSSNFAAILGGLSVDLSSTTDQVTAMDGGSNAAVQKNFEDVDASSFTGFGAVIKGSSAANHVIGTVKSDNISAGAGNDVIVLESTMFTSSTVDVMDGGTGTDHFGIVGGSTIANSLDFAVAIASTSNVDLTKIVADGPSGTALSFSAHADVVTDLSLATIDFSADTTVAGNNVIDLSAVGTAASDFTITGSAGIDAITLEAAGNETNTIVFAATGATNSTDVITGFEAGTSATDGDILNFDAFLGAGSALTNADLSAVGATAVVTEFTTSTNLAKVLNGHVVLWNEGAATITAAGLAAEFAGGAAWSDASLKGVILVGNIAGGAAAQVWYVDNSLDGNNAAVTTTDLNLVGTLATNIDVDLITGNQIA